MTTPAGWYDDGSGRQRWWDGQQWTEHFAPEVTDAAPTSEEQPIVAEEQIASEEQIVAEEQFATETTPIEDAPVEGAASRPSEETLVIPEDHAASAATTPLSDSLGAYSAPAA